MPRRRPAVLTLTFCLLAATAAAVSFTHGSWLGIVWLLLAGLTSNMGWYHLRRARGVRKKTGPAAPAGACASGGACGGCVQRICR